MSESSPPPFREEEDPLKQAILWWQQIKSIVSGVGSKPNKTFPAKLWAFGESAITWGAIGMLFGAIIPLTSLKYVFLATWVVLMVAVWRVDFCEGLSKALRVLGNILICMGIGLVLLLLWHITPKPKEPPSAADIARELIKLFPPQLPQTPVSTPPPVNPGKKGGDNAAFAVSVEVMMISAGGDYGTGYWVGYLSSDGCTISPAHALMFIRITNLQPVAAMVTSYTVDAGKNRQPGLTLIRLNAMSASVFFVPTQGAQIGNGKGGRTIQIPTASKEFYMLNAPIKEADSKHAVPLEMATLDTLLGDRYLMPKQTVRGWALFEYPSPSVIPSDVWITLTDEVGHTYPYLSKVANGNPNADTLARTMKTKDMVDLSACSRKDYYLKQP